MRKRANTGVCCWSCFSNLARRTSYFAQGIGVRREQMYPEGLDWCGGEPGHITHDSARTIVHIVFFCFSSVGFIAHENSIRSKFPGVLKMIELVGNIADSVKDVSSGKVRKCLSLLFCLFFVLEDEVV